MKMCGCPNTILSYYFRRLSGGSCHSPRQRTLEEDNTPRHGAKVSTVLNRCSSLSPGSTGVSHPASLLSSRCLTSSDTVQSLWELHQFLPLAKRKQWGFICALSWAGFHHNVCGPLYGSWFRPFSPPQKPPKVLWISSSPVLSTPVERWGMPFLGRLFLAVVFTNQMEESKSHPISRP